MGYCTTGLWVGAWRLGRASQASQAHTFDKSVLISGLFALSTRLVQEALRVLYLLEALDADGDLTPTGEAPICMHAFIGRAALRTQHWAGAGTFLLQAPASSSTGPDNNPNHLL
jgi:hypothetical protein